MKININNVSKTFLTDIKRIKKNAVSGVSISVKSGEIFGIIGHNGAGKSTLLKMIVGFIRPDSGTITVGGKNPVDPLSRSILGYLPENPYFYDHLTAAELLQFSAQASGMPRKLAEEKIDILLEQVGLLHAKKQRLRSYSKGMTQRAGLCFALIHDPDIIILDEPMSGLDPSGRKMMVDLILGLKKRGKTVLFCSHILSDVERICDRVAVMAGGKLKRIITHEEIKSKENRIRIVVDHTTGNLDRQIELLNGTIDKRADHVTIECEQKQIDELIPACMKENVTVINIDSTLNNMEDIFFRAAGDA